MIVSHEDRVTAWRPLWWEDPYRTEVRIWLRRTAFGFFQRHEWRRRDGDIQSDDWIPSPSRAFPDHFAAPTDLPPDDEAVLLQALAAIAAGHNEPRRLAREALEAMRAE